MNILTNKQTSDDDLTVGQLVCYKNLDGVYCKLGTITDIIDRVPCKEYIIDNSFGSYTADELKLLSGYLRFYAHCTDKDGNIGSFLLNDKGEQVTQTYNSNLELINSEEYQKIKETYVNHGLGYLVAF